MAVHILTLVCPDRPGIVHSVSEGLLKVDANIRENAQFGDQPTGTFWMRRRSRRTVEDLAESSPRRTAGDAARGRPGRAPRGQAVPHARGRLEVRPLPRRPALPAADRRVVDRHSRGGRQPPRPGGTVGRHGIPFEYVPVTPGDQGRGRRTPAQPGGRAEIDLVVLARYMQILSPGVCGVLAGGSSTSTTRSCPGSRGPSRTTRPGSGA